MQHWPFPPFFKDAAGDDTLAGAEAIVFTTTDEIRNGALQRFDVQEELAVLMPHGATAALTLPFTTIKSIQLMPPIVLTSDEELTRRYQAAGGHEVNNTSRPFSVQFTDGEYLRGETKGFVKTRQGLFFYLTTDAIHCVRIFIPATAMRSYQVGGLLGQHLIQSRLVNEHTVQQALTEQERRRQELPSNASPAADTIRSTTQLAEQITQIGSFYPVRLGDLLITQGLVSNDQMRDALLLMQQDKKHLLGHILVEMGALSRAQLTEVVAKQFNIPLVALEGFVVEPDVLRLVPKEYAVEHQVLPLLVNDKSLVVAVESPVDADYLDELRFSAQKQVVPVIANPEELATRISVEYSKLMAPTGLSIEEELRQLSQKLTISDAPSSPIDPQKQVSDNDTLVVRLVNKTILDAQARGASDIHIEAYPEEQPTLIRMRVDGDLTEYLRVPFVLRAALLSRIKIMANLDISEHRLPQDGKIDFSRFGHTKLELRVAVLPTTNGLEDIVMRLLASSKPIALAKLGMDKALVDQLQQMVHRSYGLILVCGPTGSGKTTTLHSLLAEVNHPDTKIWTAEDPIEITHHGLRQIQMHPRIGLTFAAAMRAFLRADPDVIMVGEMRDSETAHIAIEASLTGHMVMSTLHTNSAPESVIRMLDMGLDPFNFADALVGVLSQRLARRLCPECKQPYTPTAEELQQIAHDYAVGTGLDPNALLADWRARFVPAGNSDWVLYRAQGCNHCDNTGYKGRVGIYELMGASPAIKKLIQTRAPVDQLFAAASEQGMLRLLQYGLLKVLEGVTDQRSVRGACS